MASAAREIRPPPENEGGLDRDGAITAKSRPYWRVIGYLLDRVRAEYAQLHGVTLDEVQVEFHIIRPAPKPSRQG